ncbi:DNA glycosylase [Poronia punctata]|nr:DNA glycosylase [Poronia punctata]
MAPPRTLGACYKEEKLSDDFLFGFDVVDDDDEKEYLAEIAIGAMGPRDDIDHFVRLGLMRGVEEWDQAIACASSMKDRATFVDPLDGQDVLAFLCEIYGVSSANPAPANRPEGLKRKSRNPCPRDVLPGKRPKKQKVAKKTCSPYWATISAQSQKVDETSERGLVRPRRENGDPMKVRSPSGPLVSQTPETPRDPPRDDTITDVDSERHGLEPSASLDSRIGPTTATPRLLSESPKDTTHDPIPEDPTAESDLDSASTSESAPPEPDTTKGPSDSPHCLLKTTGNNGNLKEENTGILKDASLNTSEPSSLLTQTPKRKAKSPYFLEQQQQQQQQQQRTPKSKPKPKPKPPRGTVSSLPFPRLDAPRFGLIQEELATDPFRLLIAVTFLIRTTGTAAIPTFRTVMKRYPTPADLAAADVDELVSMIGHLGLGLVRATAIQRYAKTWLEDPPRRGVKHAVKNYPLAGDGDGDGGRVLYVLRAEEDPENEADVNNHQKAMMISRSNTTTEWEIGHLTQGPYALDSWRIFCRDVFRGEAKDWKGRGREGETFQPEWMRVLPRDKELRACLRWMWMQEGWSWDPLTGDKVLLPDDLRRAVMDERVGYDDGGDLKIVADGEKKERLDLDE